MIQDKLKYFRKINKPTYLVLAICLLLVTFNIILAQHVRSYNSDDVSWQNTLLTWRPFSGSKAYVGAQDNFIVNLPFILLADLIAGPGRTALLLASLFMALFNFVLFYIAIIYFLRKLSIERKYDSLLPIVWLASFGFGLTALFLNTVWRDYEMGISFIYFALAAMYFYGEIEPFKNSKSKFFTAIAVLVSGFFVQSDKYFLYFTLVPILAFFIFQYLTKKVSMQKLLNVMSWALLSMLVSHAISKFASYAGLIVPTGSHRLNGLYDPRASTRSFLKSVSDIFGMTYNGKISIWLIGNILIVFLIIIALVNSLAQKHWLRRNDQNPKETWSIFLSLLTLFVILADLVIDQGGIFVYRYLIMAVYAAVLLLSIYVPNLRKLERYTVAILLSLAVMTNIAITFVQFNKSNTSIKKPNIENTKLIAAVRSLGLSKGFAGYWDANINSYFSKDIDFLPITCNSKNKTVAMPLLVNASLFNDKVDSSFIVLDPNMVPAVCSESSVIAQFGLPTKTVKVGKLTLLVFKYDIVSKMNINFQT